MTRSAWLLLPLWAACGAAAAMPSTAWPLLLQRPTTDPVVAWMLASGVAAGGWLVGGASRRVVHPFGRLPALFMTLAVLVAASALFHARLRIAPSADLRDAARASGHAFLLVGAVAMGALLPVAARVAESRREGLRAGALLSSTALLGGAWLGARNLLTLMAPFDILQGLMALSLGCALTGMACRRAALFLTNAPSTPTRFSIVDAPPPDERARPPVALFAGAALLAGALAARIDGGWAAFPVLLAASLQARRVLPVDAGRDAAWLQSAAAAGAAIAASFAGAPR